MSNQLQLSKLRTDLMVASKGQSEFDKANAKKIQEEIRLIRNGVPGALERTRTAAGTFIPDNPETPENEAWSDGKGPVRAKSKFTTADPININPAKTAEPEPEAKVAPTKVTPKKKAAKRTAKKATPK